MEAIKYATFLGSFEISNLQKALKQSSSELETSGLKNVNLEFYLELKKNIEDLNNQVLRYKVGDTWVKLKDLKDECTSIEAVFNFYMDTQGYKEVASYQTNQASEILEKIISKLNRNNYELVTKELEEALRMYEETLGVVFNSLEIGRLILKFRYQVFKYKLDDLVFDDTLDIEEFMPFILEDIHNVLNDVEVSDSIKYELKKLTVDNSFIKSNIVKVMILINLGLNKKQVSDEELSNSLNRKIYKESEIQKEYHEPSQKMTRMVYGTDLKQIWTYNNGTYTGVFAKELVPILVLEDFRLSYCLRKLCKQVDTLLENSFTDVKYLAEALIVNKHFDLLLAFRQQFYSRGASFDEEFLKAVIAHKDELDPGDLVNFIKCSDSEYLINYIFRSKREEYFTKDFIYYMFEKYTNMFYEYIKVCENINIMLKIFKILNNKIILGKLEELLNRLSLKEQVNIILKNELEMCFIPIIVRGVEEKVLTKEEIKKTQVSYDIGITNAYLLRDDVSDADKQQYLIKLYLEYYRFFKYEKECKFYLDKLCSYRSKELIIELINRVRNHIGVYELVGGYRGYLLKIFDNITDVKLKEDILDYYYEAIDEERNEGTCLLDNDIHKTILTKEKINKLNCFEAYVVCDELDQDNVLYFVKKFYMYRLKWNEIMRVAKELKDEELIEVYKYLYLGDKKAFFEYFGNEGLYIRHPFCMMMLESNPESIVDLLQYLSYNDIKELPSTTLDIFCKYYKALINKENISFNDLIDKVLGKDNYNDNFKEVWEFLTFVYHEGLINSEILLYKDSIKKHYNLYQLLLMAMSNVRTKYLRPYFALQVLLEAEKLVMWDKVLLSGEDWVELDNDTTITDDMKMVRKKKYYGDLLQLLEKAPDNVKIRIVKEIAKSGIKEYIIFIKLHYPMYIDLMFSYIDDACILGELMDNQEGITPLVPSM